MYNIRIFNKLNASDVAAAIGKNKYKNKFDIVDSYFSKQFETEAQIANKEYPIEPEYVETLTNTLGTKDDMIELDKINNSIIQKEDIANTELKKNMKMLDFEKKLVQQTIDYDEELMQKIKIDKQYKTGEKLEELNELEEEIKTKKNTHVSKLNDLNTKEQEIKSNNEHDLNAINDEKIERSRHHAQLVIQKSVSNAIYSINTNESNNLLQSKITKINEIKMEPLVKEKLISNVNSHVAIERGKVFENDILDDFENENKVKVSKRNDQYFSQIIGGLTVIAKIDGFDEEKNEIIEVKKRKNRFFRDIPEYEKVQMELYCRMVSNELGLNITKCTHIQEFNGVRKLTTYNVDDDMWNEIQDGVFKFKNFAVPHWQKKLVNFDKSS